MSIIDIFPTPVGSYALGRDITNEELDFIDKQEWVENTGNYRSVNTNLLNHHAFSSLRLFIEKSLKDYLTKTISPIEGNKFYLTQSWANVTQHGQYHHGHVHRNSLMSGVFYVSAEKGKDNIVFTNDVSSYKRIHLEQKEQTSYNSPQLITVQTGDLLLFPSELEHQVQTTKGNSDRISIAFNIFVRGVIGIEDQYTQLKL